MNKDTTVLFLFILVLFLAMKYIEQMESNLLIFAQIGMIAFYFITSIIFIGYMKPAQDDSRNTKFFIINTVLAMASVFLLLVFIKCIADYYLIQPYCFEGGSSLQLFGVV